MPIATARCQTVYADKYIQQPCKHFRHKMKATCADGYGECRFSPRTRVAFGESPQPLAWQG